MQHETLMDDCIPEFCGMVLSCTEQFELVVVVGFDDGVNLSGKDVCQVFHLETLRQRLYEFDDHSHLLTSVKLLLRVQAVVACTTVLNIIVFSEIAQQQLSSA